MTLQLSFIFLLLHIFHSSGQAGCPLLPLSVTCTVHSSFHKTGNDFRLYFRENFTQNLFSSQSLVPLLFCAHFSSLSRKFFFALECSFFLHTRDLENAKKERRPLLMMYRGKNGTAKCRIYLFSGQF